MTYYLYFEQMSYYNYPKRDVLSLSFNNSFSCSLPNTFRIVESCIKNTEGHLFFSVSSSYSSISSTIAGPEILKWISLRPCFIWKKKKLFLRNCLVRNQSVTFNGENYLWKRSLWEMFCCKILKKFCLTSNNCDK